MIAEVGHNHQGSVKRAQEIFDVAKKAGANAVKLQKRDNINLYTSGFYHGAYRSGASYGDTYGAHREFLEFSKGDFLELQDYAREIGITLFATPFDMGSVDFLEELDTPFYKIASASITNLVLLRYVARNGKPLLLSTGGASMEDIYRAYDTVWPINHEVVLLQCTAAYPCPPEYMNLGRITELRKEFPDAVIGLSSHYAGAALLPVAFALGARLFETHVTFDRAARGTDHGFSMEEGKLERVIDDLRATRAALQHQEQPFEIEEKPIWKMAQAIYPKIDLEAGTTLSEWNTVLKSPAEGIPAWKFDKMMGKKLTIDVRKEEPLSSTALSD